MKSMKLIAPLLLFLGSCALCWGFLEFVFELRVAVDFVRPYHYGGILASCALAVTMFWPSYQAIGKRRRVSIAGAALLFSLLLLGLWALSFPISHRLAVHDQLQAAGGVLSPEGQGWFYPGDSGMGRDPIQLTHLLWAAIFKPWLAVLFLAFFPCFFGLHRSFQASARHELPLER